MPARTPGQATMTSDRLARLTVAERAEYQDRRRRRTLLRTPRSQSMFRPAAGGINITMLGGVHAEPNFFRQQFIKKRTEAVRKAKKPINTERWAAVEIEFVASGAWDVLEFALAEAGLGDVVHLKEDGSVHGGGDRTHEYELVVCSELSALPGYIDRVCRVLKSDEINGGVNKTCGLHIHLDMRNFKVEKAYRNLVYAYDGLLSKLVPKARVNNSYCKAPPSSDFEDAVAEDDRYLAVNPCAYERHRTLEVRIFAGTINPEKIIQYLSVVSAIAYTEQDLNREWNTPEQWATNTTWPDGLKSWVIARAKDLGNE